MKTIGIIGYGKFGIFLQEIFEKHIPNVKVKFSSRSNPVDNETFFEFSEVCKADLLIPSVPIKYFEKTIEKIIPEIGEDTILMDVCSVKIWPKTVLKMLMPKHQVILTHPMFGPESYKRNKNNVEGFNLVIENLSANQENYERVKLVFENMKLNILEIDADEHDCHASSFHFVTMFSALFLKNMNLDRSEIETESAKKMFQFVDRVGDDHEILQDMFKYNPYCQEKMRNLEKQFGTMKDLII